MRGRARVCRHRCSQACVAGGRCPLPCGHTRKRGQRPSASTPGSMVVFPGEHLPPTERVWAGPRPALVSDDHGKSPRERCEPRADPLESRCMSPLGLFFFHFVFQKERKSAGRPSPRCHCTRAAAPGSRQYAHMVHVPFLYTHCSLLLHAMLCLIYIIISSGQESYHFVLSKML